MRILHFDVMFHPFLGYQINILPKFEVLAGHTVKIITARDYYPRLANVYDNTKIDESDLEYTNKTGVEIERLTPKRFLFKRPLFDKEYIEKIKEFRPDVILCHGNGQFSSIKLLKDRKKIGVPIIFDSHMVEIAKRSMLHKPFTWYYRLFIAPIIRKEHLYIIKTSDDLYLNDYHGIPENLTPYLGFGSDTDLFHPNMDVKTKFKQKYNLNKNDFVILYTGKVTAAKGGMLLAEAFKKKFPTSKNVVLVVVTDFSGEYETNVKKCLDQSENRIIYFPVQKYLDLPQFYQSADIMVFPKQCSLSFFDAQACGLPVVLENIEVNNKRIIGNNGKIFNSGDKDDFIGKIAEFINADENSLKEASKESIEYITNGYDYADISRKYDEYMNIAINEFYAKKK